MALPPEPVIVKAVKIAVLYLAAVVLFYLGMGVGLQLSVPGAYALWAAAAALAVYATVILFRRR